MPELSFQPLMQAQYRIASITGYNRLETAPRTVNFDRSLRAEVRDALWMLTRQWQFGEFEGEDAASPVTAQILGMHTAMDRLCFPAGQPFAFPQEVPLETLVEREPIRPDLFLAVQTGRYFLKLMKERGLAGSLPLFLSRYPLNFTLDPNDTDALLLHQTVAGRVFNGAALLQELESSPPAFKAWVLGNPALAPKAPAYLEAAGLLCAWHRRNYSQPDSVSGSAWQSSQLEYRFSVSSPKNNQLTLTADQYCEGHLDWYSFDLDPDREVVLANPPAGAAGPVENYASFIPAPISFKGMPKPRFWMMEEGQTDFGKIDTSPTGLLHLMLAEFGLIYSNDWFMLPYPLAINTLCEIRGLVVTDVFGQEVLIRPAGRGAETSWHRWSMFRHSSKKAGSGDTSLFYLAPSITRSLESPALEEVNFLRDEMANMVWAVESIVPSQAGKGVRGQEMAKVEKAPAPFVPAAPGAAEIRYVLGTTVPQNWTPFIPVHLPGSSTEIRFQRGRMPGAKPPFGQLLKEQAAPCFINEEEIPRSGVIVSSAFQRTRWLNGKTYLWKGRYKEAGKGEGWSNLKFDQIEEIGG